MNPSGIKRADALVDISGTMATLMSHWQTGSGGLDLAHNGRGLKRLL